MLEFPIFGTLDHLSGLTCQQDAGDHESEPIYSCKTDDMHVTTQMDPTAAVFKEDAGFGRVFTCSVDPQ